MELEQSDKKSWHSNLEILISSFMSILSLLRSLYTLVRVVCMACANHVTVLPCAFNSALIIFPMCSDPIFNSIKKAWNLFLAWHPGYHAHQSNKSFHAVSNTAFDNSPWLVLCSLVKRTMWKFELKDSHKRYLICFGLIYNLFGYCCFFINTLFFSRQK